jgi:hypothetical protein
MSLEKKLTAKRAWAELSSKANNAHAAGFLEAVKVAYDLCMISEEDVARLHDYVALGWSKEVEAIERARIAPTIRTGTSNDRGANPMPRMPKHELDSVFLRQCG